MRVSDAASFAQAMSWKGSPSKNPLFMGQFLEVLLLQFLQTRGDMQKWLVINNCTWSDRVERENAQEADFRELYADMAIDGWFSD